jgi:hypothetical protein
VALARRACPAAASNVAIAPAPTTIRRHSSGEGHPSRRSTCCPEVRSETLTLFSTIGCAAASFCADDRKRAFSVWSRWEVSRPSRSGTGRARTDLALEHGVISSTANSHPGDGDGVCTSDLVPDICLVGTPGRSGSPRARSAPPGCDAGRPRDGRAMAARQGQTYVALTVRWQKRSVARLKVEEWV